MSLLKEFLEKKMSMSGPYQPVVIKLLLESGGKCSIESIAKFLSSMDLDSIDYYKSKLKIHPKKVLTKHGVANFESNMFLLSESMMLSLSETKELIEICNSKIAEYYSRDLQSEQKNSGWGLKRVKLITEKPYCELCGQRPGGKKKILLDIDHILPRSKGGSDDIENLQVLCHECNRGKNNNLIKSAKDAHDDYLAKDSECIFCNIEKGRIVFENDYIFVIKDKFPVTEGHTLIIPKRHVSDATELTDIEYLNIMRSMKDMTNEIKSSDNTVKGFNVGFNIGADGGQTVFHAHFHIIPRRQGDIDNSTGGIRNVIPGKGKY